MHSIIVNRWECYLLKLLLCGLATKSIHHGCQVFWQEGGLSLTPKENKSLSLHGELASLLIIWKKHYLYSKAYHYCESRAFAKLQYYGTPKFLLGLSISNFNHLLRRIAPMLSSSRNSSKNTQGFEWIEYYHVIYGFEL